MAVFDMAVALAGSGAFFLAIVLIGYEMLRKHRKEKEIFDRYHVEEAMRIKARQYQSKD